MKEIIKDHVPCGYKYPLLIITMTLLISSSVDAAQVDRDLAQSPQWGTWLGGNGGWGPQILKYQTQQGLTEALSNGTGNTNAIGRIGYANGAKLENGALKGYSGYVMLKLSKCSNAKQLAHTNLKITQPEGYKDAWLLGDDNQPYRFNTPIPANVICGRGDSYFLFKPDDGIQEQQYSEEKERNTNPNFRR